MALPEPTVTTTGCLRVLLVEDENLVALILEDMLIELGHHVIGPVAGVAKALSMAAEEVVDVAILDININGGDTYEIAAVLNSRDIPIIFATGYDPATLREPYRYRPILQKPFKLGDLRQAVATARGAAAA